MSETFSFNARSVEPSTPREDGPVPAGWYRMWIVASEIKPTKKGDGKRMELEMDVIEGPHKNRKVWEGLNIQNPNEQAQEIALRDLSAICHAIGVLNFTHPQQLHRKPMLVKVGIEKREGYKDRNIALGYREDGAGEVGTVGTASPRAVATTGSTTTGPQDPGLDDGWPFGDEG
jgi:hypothetical protein